MDLYLIRHAHAVPLGVDGTTDDAIRPLSEEGRRQAHELAAVFTRRGIRLECVVTSPVLRARQTAEGMRQGLGETPPQLYESQELAPGGKRSKLARFLRQLGRETIAVVGHQPDLGKLVAWLIGSKKASVDLAKAGIAHVHSDEGPGKSCGTLIALLPPEWVAAPAPPADADGC